MTSSSIPDQLSSSNVIAVGTTGLIYALTDEYVLKRRPEAKDPFIHQAVSIELRVYERLGTHPRIARVHETTGKSIVLERGECLRRRLQRASEPEPIPLHTKLQWAQEAAEGLRYVHEKGIIHADVGCHNLILGNGGQVKYIDFAGSGIDTEPALVIYEWCSYKPDPLQPDAPASIRTDIFAFGSMLYEIECGRVPFHDLQATLDVYPLMRRVEGLFGARQYPDLEGMVLGGAIRGCWDGLYGGIEEVWRDVVAVQDGGV